jgi:hypothetical protein
VKNIQRTLVLGASIVALAGCGADEIVSPGTSGDINITDNSVNNSNNTTTTPAPSPTPTPPPSSGLVTPASDCPNIASTGGLTNSGTITGPTGTYRVCTLPAQIDRDDALPYVPGLLYALGGRVDVGEDEGFDSEGTAVTLNIDPGVIVYGATGRSFLVVNRGNALDADGTAAAPIIFTSRDNILGLANDNTDQQWGGLVLLGRAPTSDCSTGVFNTDADPTANTQCEQLLEGTTVATVFGGTDDDDSSGSLSFMQIRFSGFAIAPGDELQALTTGATGAGTNFRNIMSFNSSDDGIEFFGGTVNMKNVAVVGASDDSIDADTGTQGNLQYVVVAQRSNGVGDSIIELDSPPGDFSTDARPQTILNVANFTFIQGSEDDQAVRARGGSQINLINGIIDAQGTPCVRIDQPVTLAAGPTFNSIVGDCGADRPFRGSDDVSDAEVADAFNAGDNNSSDTDITFTNGFFFDASSVTASDPTTLSSFFDATDFIGAIDSAGSTRFVGWTCDSSILNFNSGSQCSSLPRRQGEG